MRPIVNFIRVRDPEREDPKHIPGFIPATLPSYATPDSSGFDFTTITPVIIEENVPTLIPTGWKVEIDDSTCKESETFGIELQIRPRSGLALREGITVLNTPGTIDKDYRGEIGIIVCWNGYVNPEGYFDVYVEEPEDEDVSIYTVKRSIHIPMGTKIAQGVLVPIYKGFITEAADFKVKNTERGEGGFGSTGE